MIASLEEQRKALLEFLADPAVVALADLHKAPIMYLVSYVENQFASTGQGPLSLIPRE